MNERISKALRYSLYAALGVSALLGGLFYLGVTDEEYLFYLSYFLLTAAIAGALFFPLFFLLRNPKTAIRSAAVLGVLLLLFFIAYLASSSEVLPSYEKYGITPGESRWIGTGLAATYLLGAGSILAILFSGISRFLR